MCIADVLLYVDSRMRLLGIRLTAISAALRLRTITIIHSFLDRISELHPSSPTTLCQILPSETAYAVHSSPRRDARFSTMHGPASLMRGSA
jgi:hypothetical protein